MAVVGNVVPSGSADRVSQASLVNNNILYTVLVGGGGASFSSLDLSSGHFFSAPIDLKRVRWGVEDAFSLLWVNNRLVLFLAGQDTGFDQIAYVDPTSGTSEFLFDNLAEHQLFFMCQPSTKSCDVLQTAAYDSIENRIYFQATNIVGDDDIGTTVLMFIDINGKTPYIDTGLNPFTFGYLGFQFVAVVA
jgi:hypothetical protein